MTEPNLPLEEASVSDRERTMATALRLIHAENDLHDHTSSQLDAVIRADAGEPLRIVGTNWDVTEARPRERSLATALGHEKQLILEAQAGNHAKSQFLAVMSPEIRTPMNGIQATRENPRASRRKETSRGKLTRRGDFVIAPRKWPR